MLLEVSTTTVFLAALVTALATGLGALPFLVLRDLRGVWLAHANATAAGLMLAASHSLIVEGVVVDAGRTVAGMAVGTLLIALGHRHLPAGDGMVLGVLRGADARKALLIVAVMTLHSAAEGIGVGVAFGGGETLGVFITTAIAVHNIPEGLAISLVLVPRGVGVLGAAWWSVFSSLPQPLLAVPAYLFVTLFAPFLPVGLGLAAGAMIWMTLAELIPDALERTSGSAVAVVVTVAMALMLAFQELALKG